MYQAAVAAVTGLGSGGKRSTPELLLPHNGSTGRKSSGSGGGGGGSGGRNSPVPTPTPSVSSSLPSPSLPWWSRSMPGTPNLGRTPCSGGGSSSGGGCGTNNSPSTPVGSGLHATTGGGGGGGGSGDFLHSTMKLFLLVTPPVARIQVVAK